MVEKCQGLINIGLLSSYDKNDVLTSTSIFINTSNKTKEIVKQADNLFELYNNNLKSNLKMLDFLTSIEETLTLTLNTDQLLEVQKMKVKLQNDIIELTDKINRLG
ncbi:hypothetical protein PW52_13625 [Tamlana sedimentorum]|uniref:Uncharacterized protein n=1 Tax=Neotamlana sedimentorum TaxID=1435349 RepID=A0A0D7W518_9FLAO|nr:hypothetical protein PW52_13625 [Tamlana sedimentorum]